MDSQHFAAMMDKRWNDGETAQGEYCVLVKDRLTMHLQSYQEATNSYPRVNVLSGAIAIVEVFPGFTDIWYTQAVVPTHGEAIHLDLLDLYAVRPVTID